VRLTTEVLTAVPEKHLALRARVLGFHSQFESASFNRFIFVTFLHFLQVHSVTARVDRTRLHPIKLLSIHPQQAIR
jgi:hypothetical protein